MTAAGERRSKFFAPVCAASNMGAMKRDAKSLVLEEWQEQFRQWDGAAFRVTQLLDWLYRRKADRKSVV